MKIQKKGWTLSVFLSAVVFLGAGGVLGDEAQKPTGQEGATPAPAVTPFTGLEGLNNRLSQLENKTVVLTVEHNYLDLSDPQGNVIFKIGGVVQEDYRSYFGPASNYYDFVPIGENPYFEEGATSPAVGKSTSTFLDRKVRLDLIAIFDHLVGLRYQAELGATGYAIQDAYAFIKADPALQVQLGKFKVPIGLERLQNDTDNLFVERALPTDLVPNRDLGVELNGAPWIGVNYAVALTGGTPDNWTPNNTDDQSLTNGKEASGRFFLTPFKNDDSFLKDLGFGVAGSWSWNVNWNTNAYPNYFVTSLGQQQFFAYRTGVAPQGDFYHWSPQLYFSQGPFGLLGEYVQSIQDVGTSTATAVNLTHQAVAIGGFLGDWREGVLSWGRRGPNPRSPEGPVGRFGSGFPRASISHRSESL